MSEHPRGRKRQPFRNQLLRRRMDAGTPLTVTFPTRADLRQIQIQQELGLVETFEDMQIAEVLEAIQLYSSDPIKYRDLPKQTISRIASYHF